MGHANDALGQLVGLDEKAEQRKLQLNELDQQLATAAKKCLALGVPTKKVAALFLDHAYEVSTFIPGTDKRQALDALLQQVLQLHSLFDEPDKPDA